MLTSEQMAWDRVKAEFPNIGWEEALDLYDDLLDRLRERYGDENREFMDFDEYLEKYGEVG